MHLKKRFTTAAALAATLYLSPAARSQPANDTRCGELYSALAMRSMLSGVMYRLLDQSDRIAQLQRTGPYNEIDAIRRDALHETRQLRAVLEDTMRPYINRPGAWIGHAKRDAIAEMNKDQSRLERLFPDQDDALFAATTYYMANDRDIASYLTPNASVTYLYGKCFAPQAPPAPATMPHAHRYELG